jgi:hypothetical protein
MAIFPKPLNQSREWSPDALAMAAEAKVLSGNKLEQLVIRLQRHTGRPKEACWRLVIQYEIKGRKDHRRWTDSEIEIVREELVKRSIEEVAKKIDRTPLAIRNMLRRNQLSLREIRCDLFSVESLACALHVRKSEVLFWIEQSWLQASVTSRGKRRSFIITPEALCDLYRRHQADLRKRGLRNQVLFEAYLEYCFVPKHTVGEQLLDVRRDKKERAAFAATANQVSESKQDDDNDESDIHLEERYRVEMEESRELEGDFDA